MHYKYYCCYLKSTYILQGSGGSKEGNENMIIARRSHAIIFLLALKLEKIISPKAK